MKAAYTRNHGQVRLVPSLIPRVSLFQLVGMWLVYSFHPGTQVPVEPNVQLDFRVIVTFFWRHLLASKNDTTVTSTYIMHISADRRRGIIETKLVYSFHAGPQVLVESNLQLDFRVIVSFPWRHLFGIQKRQNSTYSSETP